MNLITLDNLLPYWSIPHLHANAMILINIVGALLLGMIVGYERSYHGRAAGMRTYGMVCMGSAAVTVIIGYPQYWFGGMLPLAASADVTRVIQGIVTGVGFLGAGVIMKEGRNISGLTTAASIWASSAIGIMCGAGFYFAAIMLALIVSATMIWGGYVESILPSRQALEVVLHFKAGYQTKQADISQLIHAIGYKIAESTISISSNNDCQEWRLILIATDNHNVLISDVAAVLQSWDFLDGYQVALARN
jgi:putative Mg2+ transporter-C (MgtC) family protein